jgi:hypothetical protein
MHGALSGLTEQFVPTEFGSGCVLWLTASRLSSLTIPSATDISAWADQTNYANNATSIGGDLATYETNGINGLPSVRFGFGGGAGNTQMTIADAASISPVNAISTSCVVRFQTSIAGFQVVFVKTTSPALSTDGYGLSNAQVTTGKQSFYINNVGLSTNYAEATGLAINTNYVLTSVYDKVNIKLYVNGTLAQTTPLTDAITYPSTSTFYIGRASTYQNFTGFMSDLVVCNFAFSTAQRQTLERGLFGQRYGITIA